jgi:hypothetical protein
VTSAARSTARLIDVDDLPIGFIDVELSMPPADLVSDTVVILLRLEPGPPAAVVKVARGILGAAGLRTQRRVLAELATQHGLDERWRQLLPRILAFDERTDATISVESYRPGIDLAEVLAGHPDRVEELTAAALRAIAPLHRRTGTFVVVDHIFLLRRWLIEPLASLADMCRRLDPGRVAEVDRLGMSLRQALVGRRMPVSWTHGDYTPGSVRVAGVSGPVTGIVGWAGARPGQLALVDEYLMVLAAGCQVQQAALGTVVSERLRAGGLLDRERNSLRAAYDRADADIGFCRRSAEGVDECVVILLTWLHHAAAVWRKRATHPDHHSWWAVNVTPVLDALPAWPGFDVSKSRARASRVAGGVQPPTSALLESFAPTPAKQTDG